MLKRIYIDNYKTLVNCEIELNEINLFLGSNGSGKSCVFEVINAIQRFVCNGDKIDRLFKRDNKTRWQNSDTQIFELEIENNDGAYKYQLSVEHNEDREKSRVKYERLFFENNPLMELDEDGVVHLYGDDFSKGPSFPADWSLSAVGAIPPRHDNKKLTLFKKKLKKIIAVQPIPPLMAEESRREEEVPTKYMENYVSWYRFLSGDQGMAFQLMAELRKIMPGFDYFRFEAVGEKHRLLRIYFRDKNTDKLTGYDFNELSDGQRMLIALYTLLLAASSDEGCGHTLCLDEPENFLALPEIQPWLTELYDRCNEGKTQALLISHHPEFINYLLASQAGYWFEREGSSPTRIKRINTEEEALPFSEILARGWLNE